MGQQRGKFTRARRRARPLIAKDLSEAVYRLRVTLPDASTVTAPLLGSQAPIIVLKPLGRAHGPGRYDWQMEWRVEGDWEVLGLGTHMEAERGATATPTDAAAAAKEALAGELSNDLIRTVASAEAAARPARTPWQDMRLADRLQVADDDRARAVAAAARPPDAPLFAEHDRALAERYGIIW